MGAKPNHKEILMSTTALHPHVSMTTEPPVYFLGLPTRVIETAEKTNGAFGVIENVMPSGFASPYHTHHLEDEAFYVVEGQIAVLCGSDWTFAGPGTYVFGPREIPHGFRVVGDTPARMLLLCAPAGFAQFVVDLSEKAPAPPDVAKLMAVAAKYKVDILGPLPETPRELTEKAKAGTDLKNLNHRWIRAFNERDWETERAVRSPNFQAHLSGATEPLDNNAWSGFMMAFTNAFPDARITIDACIEEGDAVSSRWSLTGTHQGEFQGIPATGRQVKFIGIEFNRVVDGRFVEHWSMFDNLALLKQLGVMPA